MPPEYCDEQNLQLNSMQKEIWDRMVATYIFEGVDGVCLQNEVW